MFVSGNPIVPETDSEGDTETRGVGSGEGGTWRQVARSVCKVAWYVVGLTQKEGS